VAKVKRSRFLPDATQVNNRIREGPGRTGRLFGALILPLVILTMVGSLLLFGGRANSARTRSSDVVEAQLLIYRLHTTLLQQLARGGLPHVVIFNAEVTSQTADATASIGSLEPGPATEDYAEYLVIATRVWELKRTAHNEEAIEIGAIQLGPAFDVVQRDLSAAKVSLDESALTAESWEDAGSILTLIVGCLLLLLMFRRAERARRHLVAGDMHATALRDSARRFESLMSESSDLVTVLDRDGRVTFQSGAIEQVLGWKVEEVVGHDIREFMDQGHAENVSAMLEQAELRPDSRRSVDFKIRRSNGDMLSVEAVVSGRFDDPDIAGCLLNIRDQTERLVLEEALRHQAFHDPLTALPNRALFEDRLAHAFERTTRGGYSLCLLLADLDDFKDINDTYGHALGDTVLIEVAERLRRAVRLEDTISRLGGDEFAILIEETKGEDDGSRAAERIMEALAEPILIGDVEVFAHASIGIATGSATGGGSETPEQLAGQLLIDADLAMYEAKRQGRRGFQFYASSMQEGIKERMAMRSDLEGGLSRGEFVLHYQPIVSIEAGVVVGAEALIRWQHPERGLVPPMEFIPLAEQTGLIVDIGNWVLAEACQEAAGWDLPGDGRSAPYVSVNVASSQLQQPGLVQDVRDALRDTGLAPARLVLEVTESALIEDSEGNVLKLEQLRGAGIRLAIDDFGTGYSSLSYLRQFSLDILKIDKSFIDVLGRDSKGSALVAAMVAIGTSLSMEVVAEGIEDPGQLQDLRTLHCDLGQGYLFSRPVPASELASLFANGMPALVAAHR
jgi:diguanylate cyclase (GGDEF)-like protein/PAS domain S-box-containing protein